MNAPSRLPEWRQKIDARWSGISLRERLALGGAIALVAVALLWLVALRPALRTLDSARVQAAALETQWQAMQRQAAEARQLRAVAAVAPALAAEALEGAADRLGDAAQLSMQGDQAQLTLKSVPADALVAFLTEARGAARARVTAAELAGDTAGRGLSGRLTLQLGAAP